ncbi:hypothetical protein [Arcobacter sp.]|uniref:hypothetical protein n=1 Tax=Arcobacter sp. TaxID=1872629 RepID=UPI003C76381E
MCICSQDNCESEVFENNDKCILHCEKDDTNNWYTKNEDNEKSWNVRKINFFWKKIQKELNDKYSNTIDEFPRNETMQIYKNIIFPKFQVNRNLNEDDEDGVNFYTRNRFVEFNNGNPRQFVGFNNIIDDMTLILKIVSF